MKSARNLILTALCCVSIGFSADADDPAKVKHFEEKIRPLLAAKCQGCHNDQLKMAGLSLSTKEAAMEGGGRGSAVVPGHPEQSLLVEAVQQSGEVKMPPTGPLPPDEVELLTAWVQDGAAWGASASDAQKATPQFWSFQPVEQPEPPSVKNDEWVRNPIDNFILAKLEAEALPPSEEADRRTLLRRVSLDLTGLPPTTEEIEAFLRDEEPGAYDRVVERLLASPHYGERWGRHWLDIARYADSNGYSIDGARSIWRYRDWVINAYNEDKPFDQFVIEQVAGDLLENPTEEQLVATGFHRNTMINQEGGIDFEQYRVEAVVDRVSTTGAAFLGLTVGCARCHDHKFDPIAQKEFYQLYAFFNDVDELSGETPQSEAGSMKPLLEFGTPEQYARREALADQIQALRSELSEYQEELEKDWQRFDTPENPIQDSVRNVLVRPIDERADLERGTLTRFFSARDPGWKAREDGIRALRKAMPDIESTMVMRDLDEPREAFIHVQGDFTRHGDPVEPGGISVLPPIVEDGEKATRLDLAQWLVAEDNPMTPRVTMNRFWQRYFGVGIVETEGDFGSQGSQPSHPELLDWLAAEFIAREWSMKDMHRLIVTSATYRQASNDRDDIDSKDPTNRLLARQNRTRLEAEIIRDAALQVSGLLTPKIGGPSVYPPQPAGAGAFTQVDRQWKADTDEDRYRRGMYTFFWRSAPHPSLALFDAPTAQEATTRRNRSNTPLQALTLLNDESQSEFAAALAERIMASSTDRDTRIQFAFESALARPPTDDEAERMTRFVSNMMDEFSGRNEAIDMIGAESPEQSAWIAASRVLLNLDEFVTRQ